jgi:hypothetical protein
MQRSVLSKASTVTSSVVSARAKASASLASKTLDWRHDLFMAVSDDDDAALARIVPQLKQGVDERLCAHLALRHKAAFKFTKLKYTSSDTLLLLATRNDRTKCVGKLLELGASVSLLDKEGKTAQQLAPSDAMLELISRSSFEIA